MGVALLTMSPLSACWCGPTTGARRCSSLRPRW